MNPTHPTASVLLGLHLIAAGSVWWILERLHPGWPSRLAIAALVVAPLAGMLLVGPVWPIEHFVRSHEGFSTDHLAAVVNTGSDHAPAAQELWRQVARANAPSLRGMLGIHLGATLAYVIGLWLLARRAGLPASSAALLVLAAALEPSRRHAAVAETSGAWVAPWTLMLVPPIVLLGRSRSRVDLGLAFASGTLVAMVIGLARPELGAAAMLALLARGLTHSEAVTAIEQRWHDALTPPRIVMALTLLAALLALPRPPDLIPPSPGGHGEADWVLRALHPANPTWLLTPIYFASFSALGLVGLAVVGWVRALRRPLTFAGLAGLPWLWATYQAAGHGWPEKSGFSAFEMGRYHALIAAWGVVLAVIGWRALSDHPTVRAALIGACLIPPLPLTAPLGAWRDARGDTGALPVFGWTDRDPTWETRHLLGWIDAAPECALLVRGPTWRRPQVRTWSVIARGKRLLTARQAPGELPPADALATLAPVAPCARVWLGMDVHAVEVRPPDLTGLVPLQTYERPPRPAVHPEHGLHWDAAPVTVGWYAIEGVPDDPAAP
jgi:hypothetical protein